MAPHRVRAPARHLVTLSSDIGWAYAAQMKAVLYRQLPPGSVVDLAHDLPPHGVEEAAFVVRAMAERFPAGTVHVVVVDPGVGGRRAPIVVECADGSTLVGPDNGVLAPLADALGRPRAYRIDPAKLGGPARVGRTFDGRDLFAPAASWVARGGGASQVGSPHPLTPLELPRPSRLPGGAAGVVAHVDRFGNLITNVPGAWVPADVVSVAFRRAGRPGRVAPWTVSYEALGAGRLGALVSSFGTVELAVARGSAARHLRAGFGTRLRLAFSSGGSEGTTETVNSGRRVHKRGR